MTEMIFSCDSCGPEELGSNGCALVTKLESNDAFGDNVNVKCPPNTTERKLITKIDIRLLPILSVLYLLAFLDRTNIANANVAITDSSGQRSSLSLDLALPLTGYNTALTIFFIPYILFEIPSNLLLKKLSPRVWLSACMFLFGFVTICQGLVQNYGGLLATRFFLGLAEAGMFPGCFYLIGMWYKREEAQKRFSFFFSSTSLAGAFGGLLASVISKMNGFRGYAAWRWIFILEGLLTCIVAATFFFVIPDFPENAVWATPAERSFLQMRLHADQGDSAIEQRITLSDIVNVFKDYKIIFAGLSYLGLIVPAYGYAFFAPSIIQSFGYNAIETQLPPWATAFGWSMLVAWLSDTVKHRYAFTLLCSLASVAGFAILLTSVSNSIKYGALFLVTSGTYTAMPVIVCWFNMNLSGHLRRSVGSAWQVGFGNVGGIIATYSFLAKDKPAYIPGYSVCLAFVGLSMLSCGMYLLGCIHSNQNRRKIPSDFGLTEREKIEMGGMGPGYRYML